MSENHIQFLTTSEAAQVLNVKPQTIRQYTDAGKLKGAFFGRKFHYLHSDLLAFAAENRRGSR